MTNLSEKIESKALAVREGSRDKGTTVMEILTESKGVIARQLPVSVNKDRWFGILLAECRKNHKLLMCNPFSVLEAVTTCSRLGLEVGAAQGHAYLIPFKDECVLVIGYQGYVEMAWRAGIDIVARTVYAADEFSIDLGTEEVQHIPGRIERGAPIGAYGIARFEDGRRRVHWLTQKDIERHRQYSRAKGDDSPWETHPEAMGRKSVIREMVAFLPTTTEDRSMKMAYQADESPQSLTNPPHPQLPLSWAEEPEALAAAAPDDGETPKQPNPSTGSLKRLHAALRGAGVATEDKHEYVTALLNESGRFEVRPQPISSMNDLTVAEVDAALAMLATPNAGDSPSDSVQ